MEEFMYEQFGIKKEIEDLSIKVENEIKEQFLLRILEKQKKFQKLKKMIL